MENSFGKKINELRKNKDLTLKQLSDSSGIELTYLSKIENGKTGFPEIGTIEKLVKALKVDENAREELYRLAKQIPQELKENITDRKSLFDVYRSVKDFSDKELDQMVKEIQERKRKNSAKDNKK